MKQCRSNNIHMNFSIQDFSAEQSTLMNVITSNITSAIIVTDQCVMYSIRLKQINKLAIFIMTSIPLYFFFFFFAFLLFIVLGFFFAKIGNELGAI